MASLVSMRQDLMVYHEDPLDKKFFADDVSNRTIGSISSADENDTELLSCGVY